MRIKKISCDKIVVQLTDSDLEYFDLDFCERPPQAADLHKMLFEVMELVKTETGFDPYNGGQVVVEAAMSSDGLSLTISRMGTGKKGMTREEFSKVKRVGVKLSGTSEQLTKKDIKSILDNVNIKKSHGESMIFIFNSFSDFEKAVSSLPDADFTDVLLYKDNNRYALIYNEKPDIIKYNILSEFAVHKAKNDVASYSIKEHWSLVLEDDKLSEMAENIRKMNLL